MNDTALNGAHEVANRVGEAADRARERASDMISRRREPGRGAAMAANAVGAISTSLESVSEGARAAGDVLRDRGRDAARSLSRGERVLRERGFGGATSQAIGLARRNARKIVFAGVGLATLATMRRMRRNG